jgi:hypothetical protein
LQHNEVEAFGGYVVVAVVAAVAAAGVDLGGSRLAVVGAAVGRRQPVVEGTMWAQWAAMLPWSVLAVLVGLLDCWDLQSLVHLLHDRLVRPAVGLVDCIVPLFLPLIIIIIIIII